MNGGIHKTRIPKSPISPMSSFRRQELRRMGEAAKDKANGKPELAESQSKKRNGGKPPEDQEFERACRTFWGTGGKPGGSPRHLRTLGDTPPYKRPTGGKGARRRTLGDTPDLEFER